MAGTARAEPGPRQLQAWSPIRQGVRPTMLRHEALREAESAGPLSWVETLGWAAFAVVGSWWHPSRRAPSSRPQHPHAPSGRAAQLGAFARPPDDAKGAALLLMRITTITAVVRMCVGPKRLQACAVYYALVLPAHVGRWHASRVQRREQKVMHMKMSACNTLGREGLPSVALNRRGAHTRPKGSA